MLSSCTVFLQQAAYCMHACIFPSQEALELRRPDFISRSQGRVRRLERRARRRRYLQDSDPDLTVQGLGEGRGKQNRNCTTPDPLSGESEGFALCRRRPPTATAGNLQAIISLPLEIVSQESEESRPSSLTLIFHHVSCPAIDHLGRE